MVEPGLFATDWAGSSAKRSAMLADYEREHEDAERLAAEILGAPGDPRATADALLRIVDAQEPPLRVLFGTTPLNIIDSIYKDRLKHWEEWQSIAVQAHG